MGSIHRASQDKILVALLRGLGHSSANLIMDKFQKTLAAVLCPWVVVGEKKNVKGDRKCYRGYLSTRPFTSYKFSTEIQAVPDRMTCRRRVANFGLGEFLGAWG